jgi:hypothetical protein
LPVTTWPREWRRNTAMNTTPTPPTGPDARLATSTSEGVTLPVIEEQAVIRREIVESEGRAGAH